MAWENKKKFFFYKTKAFYKHKSSEKREVLYLRENTIILFLKCKEQFEILQKQFFFLN